ncbi:MAG: PepSY-like domain-containing protein [Bacteroidota bacterium]|nr:PepSY-like domain-containing protein [Bacteroidota bacterium]
MKKVMLSVILLVGIISTKVIAQDLKEKDVPTAVKAAFVKKYPEAKKVSWEKEKGNFEANWGGKSGEDNSVVFTPAAVFVEIVVAIPINQIPAGIAPYVAKHYNNAKIKEAGKVTDASGKHMFEVEIKGKDLIFDEQGVFIKED